MLADFGDPSDNSSLTIILIISKERLFDMRRLVLNITDSCNFRCRTCLRDHGINHMRIDDLRKWMPDIKKAGIDHISITGGEPCMHPNFTELVDFLASQDLRINVVSNGSMLDKLQFLAEKHASHIGRVTISLDGYKMEVHDSIRQPGSYNLALRSMRYLIGIGTKTAISVCLNRHNINEIEGIVALSRSLGISAIGFIGMIGNDLNKDLVLSLEEKRDCVKGILQLKSRYPDISIEILSSLTLWRCMALMRLSSFTIYPNGGVALCCDLIGNQRTLGNLRTQSLEQLYIIARQKADELLKKKLIMIREQGDKCSMSNCDFCNIYA
jgi:MoaA/NifB/PqqE/SkfB family radical SAM enzyme